MTKVSYEIRLRDGQVIKVKTLPEAQRIHEDNPRSELKTIYTEVKGG